MTFLIALDDKTQTTEFTEGSHLLKNNNAKNTSEATQHSEASPHLIENGDMKTVTKRSSLHAFTVALALSVHSIFEGLALGLEDENSKVLFNTCHSINHTVCILLKIPRSPTPSPHQKCYQP